MKGMEDIELVIKISEEIRVAITRMGLLRLPDEMQKKVDEAIQRGIPLPKGHGRLIDADDINVIELEDILHFMHYEKGDDVDVYIDAPTIIEADTGSEDKEC